MGRGFGPVQYSESLLLIGKEEAVDQEKQEMAAVLNRGTGNEPAFRVPTRPIPLSRGVNTM